MNDNKEIRYVILLMGLLIVSLMIPCVAAAPPQIGHPYLLFHNISEVPGYQFSTIQPWNGYQDQVLRSADGSLSKNFAGNLGGYDRVMYRGGFARDLGLAYQITKKPVYSLKAREALLNLNVGTVSEKVDKANALGAYSLAYDFIQPTLDTANDTIIRDKLATLADTVYKDLNDNGTTRSYVSFFDYHGQAYPNVGIAGAALADYTNPNRLVLASTPEEWHKAGTDYLFVDDKLHSYGRSLFSFGVDEGSGKTLNGAYKAYVTEDFAWWLQVYNYTYGENPFEKYPAAKQAFTSELWEELPNGYSSNYVTNGNTKWTYNKGFVNLLDDQTKSNILNYDERLDASTILPYTRTMGEVSPGILYCVYGNYASITRTYPATTSHLDTTSIFQVFRENWDVDSDWLSLVTFNTITTSNRDSAHMDQLSFEYYSRGDLLLADAGEIRNVLDEPYGTNDVSHNTIAIENPRTSFPVSPWSGSTSAGIYKGDDTGLTTPSTIDTFVQMPWIQFIQTNVSITNVMAGQWRTRTSLSSPVNYERTILYPDSDYFVVVDRMEGTEPWIYRNIFRPSSLSITPTVDTNSDGVYAESEVGHVNGALTIGATPYNWQALGYKVETNTGITTNSLTWKTTNPYGKDVRLNLVSSPASEILIEKNVGRIGGYDPKSEVFNPVVWFRTPASNSEYRVTALLSSYSNEQAKNATEIAVTGTGHAIKVSSAASDDYIYTGKGTSSFAGFTTDADTVFIRKQGSNIECTLLNGSFLMDQNDPWVILTKRADAITANREKGLIDYRIQGEPDLQGDIFQQPVDSNKIEKRTSSIEQQKRNEQQKPKVQSNTNAVSEETGDIITFLENLIKSVLSIVTTKTTRG